MLVRHQPDLPQQAARRALEADAAVEFAEPNWIYTRKGDPTDPHLGQPRGMQGMWGSNAVAAWSAGKTGSAPVYVGVIDEGIQFIHPDLAGQVWVNPWEVAADKLDNDGNLYIDDINGWDFAGNNNTIYDGGTKGRLDDHGTHVSGTIGAKANNDVGVAGVNWSITLISAKFLGQSGGTTANAIKAVNYLTELKTRPGGLNLVATNNSWGGGGYSAGLYNAIKSSGDAGILFIAAAGNAGRNIDPSPSYPASYDLANIISVGALDSSGNPASWSNYGAKSVDIFAPGVGIWSTTAYNTYSSYGGTSMATPHVTGAAALYAAAKGLTPTNAAGAAQIKAAILNSHADTPSVAGKCVTGGRLDIGKLSQLP